jgi:hypothetical protein
MQHDIQYLALTFPIRSTIVSLSRVHSSRRTTTPYAAAPHDGQYRELMLFPHRLQ